MYYLIYLKWNLSVKNGHGKFPFVLWLVSITLQISCCEQDIRLFNKNLQYDRHEEKQTRIFFPLKCLVEIFHPTMEARVTNQPKGYEWIGNENEVMNNVWHMESYRPHPAGRLQSGFEKNIQYIGSAEQTFRSDMGFICNPPPPPKKIRPFFRA